MKFTTLLTIIITGYVIYYAYQIIHDLFFTKGGGHHGRGREIPACQSQQG